MSVIRHLFLLQNEAIAGAGHDCVNEKALQKQARSNGYVIIVRSPRARNLQRSQEMPGKRFLVRFIVLLAHLKD